MSAQHTTVRQGPGKFTVIEGPDGVGKTTAIEEIACYLRNTLGVEVQIVRLPGGTRRGEEIRTQFKAEATNLNVFEQINLLLEAKRHLLAEVVRPALERGHYVLCDRYIDSLLAYQWGGFSDFEPSVLQHIEDQILLEQIDVFPDLKIVLDCADDVAEKRMLDSGRTMDALDLAGAVFKGRVRRYYREYLKESPRGTTVFLETSGDRDGVQQQLRRLIQTLL